MGMVILWFFRIRPYAIRHGEGRTTGVNLAVALWIDWQQASEIAAVRGDLGMRWICRLQAALQALFVVICLAPFFV